MMQEHRHRATLWTAWGCWIGAAALTALSVFGILERPYGVAVVFLIGAAIASGLTLSRMRLAQTMTEVFRVGLAAAVQKTKEDRRDDDDNSRRGMDSSRQ